MTKLYWQNYHDIKTTLSDVQKEWLFDQGSLTKKLVQRSQHKFSLEILSESQQYLREDEYKILNISSLSFQWVREVVLKGNNIPWVYARSVILFDELLKKDPENLKNIGKQPLGSILFDAKNFLRSAIEVVAYPREHLPFSCQLPFLWARRSCFENKIYTILVQEVFLPNFWT